MKKILLHRGMSLLEVTVAIAILGLISLGVMQLTQNMNKSAKGFENKSEVLSIHNEIIGILSTPENCVESFKNASGNALSADSGVAREIKYKTRDGFLTKFEQGKKIKGKLKISSMELKEINPGSALSTRETLLHIEYDLGTSGLAQESGKTIKIWFEPMSPTDPTIRNCRALAQDNELWQRGSENMNDIHYKAGHVTMETIEGTGPLPACNNKTKGRMAYNSNKRVYEYCNGSTKEEFVPSCPKNEIYIKIDTTEGCMNAAKAMCMSVGFKDFDKYVLKTCSHMRCASLTCATGYYDSYKGCEGAVSKGEDNQIVTVTGRYYNDHKTRSGTHHNLSGTYKCINSKWIKQSGYDHVPDNSYVSIQAANN